MHGLPARQMSVILRAATDTIPTPLNLARWRIQLDPKCPLCGNPRPTIVHVLNGCQWDLEQGRFSWRHDCILPCIAETREALHSSNHLFQDLLGKLAQKILLLQFPTPLLYHPEAWHSDADRFSNCVWLNLQCQSTHFLIFLQLRNENSKSNPIIAYSVIS